MPNVKCTKLYKWTNHRNGQTETSLQSHTHGFFFSRGLNSSGVVWSGIENVLNSALSMSLSSLSRSNKGANVLE